MSGSKEQVAKLFRQYECGGVHFIGDPNASYERHLVFDRVISPDDVTSRDRFEALARALRDFLAQRWLLTQQSHDRANPKRVYYLSMEFLIGRSTLNNITNLMVEPIVIEAAKRQQVDLSELVEQEPDAGLGNGGLGRLAACFIDSLATMQIPAMGYGLRYEYGMFRQQIQDGMQVEAPDYWLRQPDPWEVERPRDQVQITFNSSAQLYHGAMRMRPGQPMNIFGIPYDRPVVGYGGKTINTLRLWSAASPDFFDFSEFSSGDFLGAVFENVAAETLTRVLYPDDSTQDGRSLRFMQEFFLVACSLADIIRRFRASNDWPLLPEKVAIQLNDTHPAMAVAELMRILLDTAGLGWDEAWDLTTRTLAYTNHTLMPEALEKWPVRLFERLLPRQLEIIYEINRRFLTDVRARYDGDEDRVRRMSLITEDNPKQVCMAHLAVVGSHSINGVAEIHTKLLRESTLLDFAEMFPERFNNKTNGVTPRRWLLCANPVMSKLLCETIGDKWITDLAELRTVIPFGADAAFCAQFMQAERVMKVRFVDWLKKTYGQTVDPDTIFDCQVKRIHEYKRQLLNVLHIVVLYCRLRDNPNLEIAPRTFFFAGKAAPAYRLAKLVIKLINNVAAVIDSDSAARRALKVVFLSDYNVTLAERLIPGADVSEQISTAGYEASGTSNMKFMMNSALTIGTRDGATIEIAEEAGESNVFLFGLTAQQVAETRPWYSPWWHVQNEPETRQAVELLFSDHFCKGEPGIFEPIRRRLLDEGDFYMHLADLGSYVKAQERVGDLWTRPNEWAQKAIVNLGSSGKFSSDRTIRQYASEIWGAKPYPLD